jgi:hypothetical protein
MFKVVGKLNICLWTSTSNSRRALRQIYTLGPGLSEYYAKVSRLLNGRICGIRSVVWYPESVPPELICRLNRASLVVISAVLISSPFDSQNQK